MRPIIIERVATRHALQAKSAQKRNITNMLWLNTKLFYTL